MAWYDTLLKPFTSTTSYKAATTPTSVASPYVAAPQTNTSHTTYTGAPTVNYNSTTTPTNTVAAPAPTSTATKFVAAPSTSSIAAASSKVTPTVSASSVGGSTSPVIPPTTSTNDQYNQTQSFVNGLQTYNDTALKEIDARIASLNSTKTPAESNSTALLDQLKSATDKLGGVGARTQQLEAAAGIPEDIQRLKDINLQIASRNAEFNRASVSEEGKLAPQFVIDQNKNYIARQQAVEIGALTSVSQALQGNIKLSQDTVDRTVSLEFQPVQNEIEALKYYIEQNKDTLSREDKKKAETLQIALDERTRLLTEAKDNRTAVLNIAGEVAKNGGDYNAVLKATTPEEALRAGGAGLLSKPTTETVAAGGQIKLINKQTGEVIANLGAYNSNLRASITAAGGSIPVDTSGGYSNYQRALDNLTAGLPISQQKAAQTKLQRAINSGDEVAIKENLSTLALSALPADQKNQAYGRVTATAAVQDIQKKLNEYVAVTGDTGILSGSLETAAQKIGQTTNPDLARIGSEMKQLFVTYRRAMTGVAFSPSESKDYKAILPDIYSVNKLNTARIDQFAESMKLQSGSILATQMGQSNYDAIFNSSPSSTTTGDPLLDEKNIPSDVSSGILGRPTTTNPGGLFSWLGSFFGN